jgi:hypothetical protein
MKTWYNVIANRLPSCHCEEPKATKQSRGFEFRTFEI